MNAVTSPCDLEVLSAYLDEELGADETARVEAHLDTCHACRHRLDGLARVTETLRGLERAAPPPILEEMVLGRREVHGARSWSGRLAQMNESARRTRSTIGLVFAMVLMLVMFVYLFSLAQSRRTPTSTVISVTSEQLGGLPSVDRPLLLVTPQEFPDPAVLRAWQERQGVTEVRRHPAVTAAALVTLDFDALDCASAPSARQAAGQAGTSPRLIAELSLQDGAIRCALRRAPP